MMNLKMNKFKRVCDQTMDGRWTVCSECKRTQCFFISSFEFNKNYICKKCIKIKRDEFENE